MLVWLSMATAAILVIMAQPYARERIRALAELDEVDEWAVLVALAIFALVATSPIAYAAHLVGHRP